MSETVFSGVQEPATPKKSVMIYTRYERFWHWSQAILIFIMLVTGLGLHGWYSVIPFKLAVTLHTIGGILLVTLWAFTTFWNFTTGQWRQYLPKKGMLAVIRFYAFGILIGAPHPYKKSLLRKQNALQSIAYVVFMLILGPAIWASGIAYLLYNLWEGFGWSETAFQFVAFVHTAAVYALVLFIIVHVYMTTTGKTPLHYIKTMITGYDKVEISEVEEEYLRQTGQKVGED